MLKRLKLLLIASLSLLLILAGCGSSESGKNEDGGDSNGGKEEKTYKIGVTQIVEHDSLNAAFEGFKKALADQGLKVEYDIKNAQGDMNTNATIGKDLANSDVDLIFANSTPSAQAVLSNTKEIPIVFTSVTDPVGAELVQSFENPGGNVTGTTDTHPDAIPNTVKFITQNFNVKNIGTIYNAGEQNSVAQIQIVKDALKGTGVNLVEKSVSTSADVKQAAESLVGSADVIYIITDNTVVSALESVISVAQDNDLPLFVGELDSVRKGGFAAYGFDYFDIGYEAGLMAAKILKGEKKPSELPVQYPQNLKLLINKKAAAEMGVEIDESWDAEFYE